ncbi:MAG: complex I NDUFA9 subunit family protein [Rickettsiales bacterium]|nr:complex I NDUFA9 subunit family protein [Rickettsiales bacterium]
MVHTPNLVTVFGGTGFVGTYVVRRLLKDGYQVRVLCRNPQAADAGTVKTQGYLGQLFVEYADISDPKTLEGKLDGSYAVINLVGVLFEKGAQKFATIHAQGAEKISQLASAAGARRFIQMSALGVERAAKSRYARTKFLGEKAVQQAFPAATILRPSVIFGREDNFFNQFACMSRFMPFMPVIGGGRTRFQPVYVDDVAEAFSVCLRQESTQGQTYELGGPEIMTFRQIIDYTLAITGRHNGVVNLPFALASAMGAVAEHTPSPMLTRDQVALLRYDNVVSESAQGFASLGIQPQAIELIVPHYLERYKKRSAA